ncbi:hypothetical protein [Pararhizobium sp.]|uniref:hypothetical protein n=1 Tax=Pararhizobium sp. TaxID=1977563 RepID=UPI002D7E69F3|nr:hypothetical protein [Pararhizobium sp.]
MQAGPAKDKLLLALVKSIGAVAIANPELSVSLGNVAAGAESGLSAAAAPAAAIVAQVVTALRAGTPGEATAAIGGPGLGGDTGGGDDDGLGNSSAS